MHTVFIAIALIVITAGAYINFDSESRSIVQNENSTEDRTNQIQDSNVLPESTEATNDIPTPTVTKSPSKTPTPAPSFSPRPTVTSDNFVYPNSSFIQSQGNTKIYSSQDHPDSISKWYKDVFEGKNMNVTAYVTTKTNDNYLYKLAAVSSSTNLDVSITIKKNSGENMTEIQVEQK